MKYLLTMIGAFLLLTSCHHDDDSDKNIATITRTVLVYMTAGNDLYTNGFAASDRKELLAGSLNLASNDNLLVLYDDNSSAPVIYRFSQGLPKIVKQFDSQINTVDPTTMKEIIQWAISNYPADSYGLVLWGHADGWFTSSDSVRTTALSSARRRAYGYDGNLWINIPNLVKALEGSVKFKYILCDCCNMQCVEDAYEFRNITDYFIGSPAEIPADGAPYQHVVSTLFDKTENIGKSIIDAYDNYYVDSVYKSKNTGKGVPLSVVKTSEMDSLATITAQKLATFMPTVGKYPLYMSMDSLVYYYRLYTLTAMYDMQGFMKKHLSTTDYFEWKAQYDKTVIYKRTAKSWLTELYMDFNDFAVTEDNCGVMSMFIPLAVYQNLSGKYDLNNNMKNLSWYYAVGWNKYGW